MAIRSKSEMCQAIEEVFNAPPYQDMPSDQQLRYLELAAKQLKQAEIYMALRDAYRTGTEGVPINYRQAAEYAERLVKYDLRIFGSDSLKTAADQVVLAQLLLNTGKPRNALDLFRRIRTIMEKHVEADPRSFLASCQGEADALASLSLRRKARKLTEQVLAQRREILGVDDPDTLASAFRLALLLARHGNRERALSFSKEVLRDQQRILGQNHPEIFASRCLVLKLMFPALPLEEAEEGFLRLYREAKEVLGEQHPETLAVKEYLAEIWMDSCEYHMAACAFWDIYLLREKVMDDHRDTITALKKEAYCWGLIGNIPIRWQSIKLLLRLRNQQFNELLIWGLERLEDWRKAISRRGHKRSPAQR